METALSPSWQLTTDHPTCSHGEPVLEHRATRQAYHAQDLVQLYPSFSLMRAGAAVRRLAWTATLNKQGRNMVGKFCGSS